MTDAIGRKRWVIPEGFIPPQSMINANRALLSHEAACLLNAGDKEAHVRITLFFTDREPVGPYKITLGARRTLHLRFNELSDPEPIPPGEDYASVIESDQPIVVQHTRLDSRAAEIALLSTMAWPAD
uniref:sensory rhodopsin transducer n=1 Tax=Altererythrobacter segetis TaxID=1104773 RepID=UPI00140AE521|nr:sensory rhodopsin transducer [Altererythrobacter segetis]